jgi:hypothetical protein
MNFGNRLGLPTWPGSEVKQLRMRSRKRIILICAAVWVIMALAPTAWAANGDEPTINLDLKDVDVRAAIEALFKNTGRNYAIDAEVQGVIPSVSFKDVPFEQALRNLLKTAGLVYRVDGNIYYISKKPPASISPTSGLTSVTADVGATVDTTTAEETVIEKVPLSNTGATEILSMMGGSSTGTGYGGYGGYGGMMGGYGGMMGGYGGYGGMMGGYGGYGGMMGSYGGGYGRSGYGGYGGYGGGFGGSYGGYGGGYSGYGGYSGGYGGSSYRRW